VGCESNLEVEHEICFPAAALSVLKSGSSRHLQDRDCKLWKTLVKTKNSKETTKNGICFDWFFWLMLKSISGLWG
jgi:hypothetical protein